MTNDTAKCELCGQPMPAGEEVFRFHGYSGACPAPPLPPPGTVPPSSTWGDLGRAAKCSRCNDDGRPCSHCEETR